MSKLFDLFAGIGILAAGMGTCNYLTCKSLEPKEAPATPIIQRQVVGNEQPDVCIVNGGVYYCSEIDGKSLENFIQDCYQTPQPVEGQ